MQALILTDYKQLELGEMPRPEFAADEVLVRVAACGVCGSDVHGWDGSSGRRIPPLVMGHEAAGTVAKVGAAVKDFQPGDRVTFDSTVSCGACNNCRRGRINLCERRMVLGVSCGEYRRHGAFAEYVSVPARILYRLPEELPFEHAALVEAVSIAVHAVARSGVESGQSVLVVGTGMIGLLVVQVLRHAGCEPIFAIDQDADRLALAKRFGATAIAPEQCPEVDAAFEVVGIDATVGVAIESTRKGGVVTLVGNVSPKVALPLQSVVTRELTLSGSCGSSGEYPECLRLMSSGAVDVAPLISATAPLAEGPAWFDRLYRREPGLMKVILQP
jgi:L-iditol 2-dehydrogenase